MGLPARWRHRYGAYYYRVPQSAEHLWDGKKEFLLGHSLAQAHKTFSDRFEGVTTTRKTVEHLLTTYELEHLPTLSPSSQIDQPYLIKPLRAVFGKMAIEDIKPSDCYAFVDQHESKSTARHAIGVLSAAYTLAIRKGWMDDHPLKGKLLFRKPTAKKTQLTDDEIISALKLPSKRKAGSVLAVQAFIRLKLLIGARRIDILRITESQLKDDGIHLTPSKTEGTSGRSVVIEWTPELREAVSIAKQARPVDLSPYLFCNRRGECYVDENGKDYGWKSMWQRFNERLKEELGSKRNWTEALLRSRAACDSESLEHAQALLAHASSNTTKRFYRQKAEKVRPTKTSF